MKSFILSLVLALSAITANAAILGAPYMPEVDKRFDAIEQGQVFKQGLYPAGAADGHYVKQIAQVTYDFSKVGGSNVANPNGLGAGVYGMSASLPANAIILHSFVYSITQPTTSASGTLAFFCQNAGDVLATTAAASFGAAGASIEGAATGTTYKYTTAACQLKAKIATGALSAGKVTAYIEYAVHQ